MAHSHVNFMGQITKLLVNAGHDVTVLSTQMDPLIKDPYHIPGKIYYTKVSKQFSDFTTNSNNFKNIWISQFNFFKDIKMFNQFLDFTREQGSLIMNDEELEKFVISQKFDAAIGEGIFPYIFGFFKAWKIEITIVTSSTLMQDRFYPIFGIPFPTSYVPSYITGSHDKMSYKERIANIIGHYAFAYFLGLHSDYATMTDIINNKYGKGFYDGRKIFTECSFVLINSNPFLDIPTPKSPKMIEISGIGIPRGKKIDKEFDEILSRRNKTILISFGTVVKSIYMSQDFKNGILETIKSLPDITFIWKYEAPEDGHGKGIENLVLSKWVPQTDLLSDERLSLFITHGGMGSTIEVAFNNVPALGIPVFGDQLRNVKLLERLEIGLAVDKNILGNPKELREKILEVLNNEKYKNNSIKTASMLQNRPISSEELVVKHIEFACKFGKLPMLDLASKDMGVIEYYNLDIYIPLIIILLALSYGMYRLIRLVVTKLYFKIKNRRNTYHEVSKSE